MNYELSGTTALHYRKVLIYNGIIAHYNYRTAINNSIKRTSYLGLKC